jgi:hypothetical protein
VDCRVAHGTSAGGCRKGGGLWVLVYLPRADSFPCIQSVGVLSLFQSLGRGWWPRCQSNRPEFLSFPSGLLPSRYEPLNPNPNPSPSPTGPGPAIHRPGAAGGRPVPTG